MIKYKLPVLGMIILLAVIVAGCGSLTSQENQSAPGEAEQPQVAEATTAIEEVAPTGVTAVPPTEEAAEALTDEIVIEEEEAAVAVEPETDSAPAIADQTKIAEIPQPVNDLSDGDYHWSQLLARDSIAPIYDPEFVTAEQAPYEDNELVIGVAINGEAKAYAIGPLNSREMVNDTVGGTPVLVTW